MFQETCARPRRVLVLDDEVRSKRLKKLKSLTSSQLPHGLNKLAFVELCGRLKPWKIFGRLFALQCAGEFLESLVHALFFVVQRFSKGVVQLFT